METSQQALSSITGEENGFNFTVVHAAGIHMNSRIIGQTDKRTGQNASDHTLQTIISLVKCGEGGGGCARMAFRVYRVYLVTLVT